MYPNSFQSTGWPKCCVGKQEDRNKTDRQTEGRMAGQPAESGEDENVLEEFISMQFNFLPESY